MAHDLAYDRSIFLLDKILIIFHLRTAPCEGQVFVLTIGHQQVVDELAPIVRINPKQRKWEETPCALNGGQNRFLALIEQWETFGPARRHIRHGQCIEKASGKACPSVHATMCDQISLHKAGLSFISLRKGANGNQLFEQSSGSCGGDAMQILYSRSAQQAICGCRTHG